jgi:hypothetical protein
MLTSHVSSSSTGWVASQGSSTEPAASCRTDSATGNASGSCDAKPLQAHSSIGHTNISIGHAAAGEQHNGLQSSAASGWQWFSRLQTARRVS